MSVVPSLTVTVPSVILSALDIVIITNLPSNLGPISSGSFVVPVVRLP